jgi:hypothetical protein
MELMWKEPGRGLRPCSHYAFCVARFDDSVQTGRLAARQQTAQFQHGRGGDYMSHTVPPPSPATNRETFLGSSYFER